ncbi:MAG: alpha/beta fold hydrolase [Planctomycetota bacterium]
MKQTRFARPGATPGRSVHGVITLPEGRGPFPAALCVHGYTISCEWGFWPELARRLAAVGIATARYNASGDGFGADLRTVDGLHAVASNTYSAEIADLDRVRAALASDPRIDSTRAITVGHSRGGAISLMHAAAHGDYRGVVTWAAADSVLRFSQERIAAWRRDGTIDVMHHGVGHRVTLTRALLDDVERHPERFDVLGAMRRLHCPALVIHGALDRAVPVSCAHRLAEAFQHPRSEKLVLDDAGHSFGAREPLVDFPPRLTTLLARTTGFACEMLGVTPPAG